MNSRTMFGVVFTCAALGLVACGSIPSGAAGSDASADLQQLSFELERSGIEPHTIRGCAEVLPEAAALIESRRNERDLMAVLYLGTEYLDWTVVTISRVAGSTRFSVRIEPEGPLEFVEPEESFENMRAMFNADYSFRQKGLPPKVDDPDHDVCIIVMDRSSAQARCLVTSLTRYSPDRPGNEFLTKMDVKLERAAQALKSEQDTH